MFRHAGVASRHSLSPGGQKGQEWAARKLVGAAGFEPATLCLAANPAFLRGLDYLFGIAAALLIVSEDSPHGAFCPVRGCLLMAPPLGWRGWVPSIPQRPAYGFISPHALLKLKADALSPELRAPASV